MSTIYTIISLLIHVLCILTAVAACWCFLEKCFIWLEKHPKTTAAMGAAAVWFYRNYDPNKSVFETGVGVLKHVAASVAGFGGTTKQKGNQLKGHQRKGMPRLFKSPSHHPIKDLRMIVDYRNDSYQGSTNDILARYHAEQAQHFYALSFIHESSNVQSDKGIAPDRLAAEAELRRAKKNLEEILQRGRVTVLRKVTKSDKKNEKFNDAPPIKTAVRTSR